MRSCICMGKLRKQLYGFVLTFPQPIASGQLNGPAFPAVSQEARASSAWHLEVTAGPFSTAESQPSGSCLLFSSAFPVHPHPRAGLPGVCSTCPSSQQNHSTSPAPAAGQHPSQVHSETRLLQGLESACRDSHCAKGQPKTHTLLFHLRASSVSCPQACPHTMQQLNNLPH